MNTVQVEYTVTETFQTTEDIDKIDNSFIVDFLDLPNDTNILGVVINGS